MARRSGDYERRGSAGDADLVVVDDRIAYVKAGHPSRRDIKFNDSANIY